MQTLRNVIIILVVGSILGAAAIGLTLLAIRWGYAREWAVFLVAVFLILRLNTSLRKPQGTPLHHLLRLILPKER